MSWPNFLNPKYYWDVYRSDVNRMYNNFLDDDSSEEPAWYDKVGARIAAEVPVLTVPPTIVQNVAEWIYGPPHTFRDHTGRDPPKGSHEVYVNEHPLLVHDDRPSPTYVGPLSFLKPSPLGSSGGLKSIMPKPKAKQRSKTSKTRKGKRAPVKPRRRRGQKRSDLGMRKQYRRQALNRNNIPIAKSYAPTVNSGTLVRWGPGRKPGCVVTSMRFRVAQLVSLTNSSVPALDGVVAFNTNNGNLSFCLPLNINNGFYWPAYICDLTNLFNYWYVLSARLVIRPRVDTNISASYTLGFNQDPTWAATHGQLNTIGGANTPNPTETAITSFYNACTNVAYRPCTVGSNHDQGKQFFIASTEFDGAIDFNSMTASTARLSIGGMWYVAGNSDPGQATDSSLLLADVYCEIAIELCDFGFPITTGVALKGFGKPRPRVERKKFVALSEPDNLEVIPDDFKEVLLDDLDEVLDSVRNTYLPAAVGKKKVSSNKSTSSSVSHKSK